MTEDIMAIKETLQSLGDAKRSLQLELSSMNFRVRTEGWLEKKEYRNLCFKQFKVKQEMCEIEKLIGAMKCELRKIAEIEHRQKKGVSHGLELVLS